MVFMAPSYPLVSIACLPLSLERYPMKSDGNRLLSLRAEAIYAVAGDLLNDTVDLVEIIRDRGVSLRFAEDRRSLIETLRSIDNKMESARLMIIRLKNMTATEIKP